MSFKTFDLAHDVASIQSAINEVVALSSSLFTTGSGDANVKNYNNIASGTASATLGGYWQTIYDSSPLSPLATPLVDLTFGFASSSIYNVISPVGSLSASLNEKVKVYRQIANVLLGSPDQTFTFASASQLQCFFFMVKRGLMKDELKKGSVQLMLSSSVNGMVTASDAAAVTNFKQTVGGDFAPLVYNGQEVGQVWYNAGIIVVAATGTGIPWTAGEAWSGSLALSASNSVTGTMRDLSIDDNVDGLRAHIQKIGFHNQTNLYSTIYFCRATNAEFNYSSNPTFLDSSTKRILVTSGSNVLQTRAYVTTIGLYDANDNLLAVGKLNKPLTKSPDNEQIFRIRLDY